MPQSLTHTHVVGYFFFIFNCGVLSLKSCTSVMVTAMQVERKDSRRETLHWHKREQRLDTDPGTTVMLTQTCTSWPVGLERSDVILTAQLHDEVSHSQPAPVTPHLKTLLQHGELTKLKSRSDLCHILPEDRNNWVLKGIMSVLLPCREFTRHWRTCFGCCCVLRITCFCFPLLNNCKACCEDLPFVELIYLFF